MADAVAITRESNGVVTASYRNKIIRALARPTLFSSYKLTILKWLPTKQEVTNGSTIKTALEAAHAISAIW